MADNPPPTTETPAPKKEPLAAGPLMAIGLLCVLLAAWCAYDLYAKDEWIKEGHTWTIRINWGGMIGFGLAAAYSFVMAVIRSKKPPTDASGPSA